MYLERKYCIECNSPFDSKHPRTVCCSDECKLIRNRRNKLKFQKEYYKKYQGRYANYQRDRANMHREKVYEYLGGKVCNRCGLTHECNSIFEVHHQDSTSKEANISNIITGSWDRIEKELQNTILLCSNCHRVVHWELKKESK